jgi:MFS family permease
VLADRVRRRRALVLLQSLMLLDALTLGVLTVIGEVTVYWVMALAVIHGTSSAFEVPIRQTYVLDMVGRDDLMNAIALNSSNFNLTRIVGPAIAGAVISTAGVAPCFFVNAASFLAVIASFLLMRGGDQTPTGSRGDAVATFAEGTRYAIGEPEPRALLALTAVYSIFGFAFITMLPVYAREVLRTGARGYGGLMTAVGLGASAGALTLAAIGHRYPRLTVIRVAGWLFGAALAAAAFARTWWLAAFVLGLAGCAMVLNNVSANAQLQTSAPDHLRGRVMGFYSLMVLGMAPFGSLQAGWVSERFGVPASLGVGAVVCLLATLRLAKAWSDRYEGGERKTSDEGGVRSEE